LYVSPIVYYFKFHYTVVPLTTLMTPQFEYMADKLRGKVEGVNK